MLSLNFKCAMAHYGLGVVFRKRRELPLALDHYRYSLALDLDGKEGHVWNNIGQTLFLLGREAEGILHLKKAVRINATEAKLRRDLEHHLECVSRSKQVPSL